MLGKVFKHEFQETLRMWVPVAAIIAILTPISSGLFAICSRSEMNVWIMFLVNAMAVIYFVMLVGFAFSSTVITVYRFYRSMASDESYLTHTLPVETHHLVFAKLIVAFALHVLTILLAILSVMAFYSISTLGGFNLPSLVEVLRDGWSPLREAMSEIGAGGVAVIAISIPISILSSTLFPFASIAIGQMMKGHRVLGAICAYIGIYTLQQIVASVFVVALTFMAQSHDFGVIRTYHVIMNGSIGLSLAFAVIFFFVTTYMFKRKLNLD